MSPKTSQLYLPLKKFDWETIMPSQEAVQAKLEPFLKPQFGLYGGTIKLQLNDIQQVMSEEVYKHHKVEINRQRARNEAIQSENDGLHMMCTQLRKANDQLKDENEQLTAKMKQMEWDFSNEMTRLKFKTEQQV